jgi:nitroreductase/NAD-dependent dihydropyrimidine dehydrogenase PreA subunit
MAILDINYDECNACKSCLRACSRHFNYDKDQKRVIFDDPEKTCSLCGRCIAICPQNAIIYENMGEILEFDGIEDQSTLVSYDTMHKFLISKRSIRAYKKKKIPKDVMEKILESMRYAPTGGNIRTMECTVISDENKIKTLSDYVTDTLVKANPVYAERMKKAREAGFDSIFYKAPAVLIIHSKYPGNNMNSTIALTYGMISAQALGVASCWIGLAHGVLASSEEARENLVGIKGNIEGVITLGYPAQKYYKIPPRPMIKTFGLEKLG